MNEHNDIPGMDPDSLDWEKSAGLLPAIVQDAGTLQVLMLGYMDRAALAATLATGRVTFFSRSRQRAWTKGETSGNTLELVAVRADCDADALLVLARPRGPTLCLGICPDQADSPGDPGGSDDAAADLKPLSLHRRSGTSEPVTARSLNGIFGPPVA